MGKPAVALSIAVNGIMYYVPCVRSGQCTGSIEFAHVSKGLAVRRRDRHLSHCEPSVCLGLRETAEMSAMESLIVIVILSLVTTSVQDDGEAPNLDIVMLIHPYNKVNFLPFSLGGIEHQQDFPKDQIHLIFRVGVYGSQFATSVLKYSLNQETLRILYQWVDANEKDYHKITVHEDIEELNDETDREYWTANRFGKLMQMKERSVQFAIADKVDFILIMDADVILTNDKLLNKMLMEKKTKNENMAVFAPMLDSLGTYSNFWAGMSDKGYYVRTTDYMDMIERQKVGSFAVPMIHSCLVIDLRNESTHSLKFSPDAGTTGTPFDDIISFAFCARTKSIQLFVNNEHVWGYIPPAVDGISNQFQKQELIDLELESLLEGPQFPIARVLRSFVKRPEKEALGFDKIYIINLKRRMERRLRMEKTLEVIGLQAEFWEATDGRNLTGEGLREMGVTVMPGYKDPYHKRPMTMGEIGCFLSHYFIWMDVRARNYSKVIVLEDDVRFERNMKHRLQDDLRQLDLRSQDFIYLGRKRQAGSHSDELRLFPNFVRPKYSYWTIGYIITRSGAEKLIAAQPLANLIPVDEFLPVMYDQHPVKEWTQHFPNRNLKALSIDPLILSPSHYVGDQEYISDTEDSEKISLSADHPKLNSPPHGHRHSEL